MPERASVFETIYLGVETTPGTAVIPTRTLNSMSIQPSPKVAANVFTPYGNKFPTLASKGKDYTEAKLAGQPDYNEIIYFLSSILTAPTTVAAGTGYQHTFSPQSTAADNPMAFTVLTGSESVRAGRFPYGLLNSFGLKYTRNSIETDGSMFGQKYLDDRVRYLVLTGSPTGGTFTITVGANTTAGINYNAAAAAVQSALEALASVGAGNVTVTGTALPTGPLTIVFADSVDLTTLTTNGAALTGGSSPAVSLTRIPISGITSVALKPIVPEHVSVYFDTSSGALGTTKLLRVLSLDWNISDRYGMVWPIDAAQSSFAAHVELKPKTEIKMTLAADAQGMGLFRNLRQNDMRFVRILAEGDTFDTNQRYTLRVDQAAQVVGMEEFKDEDGVFAVGFNLQMFHDSTYTRALQVLVKNTVASVA